MSDWWVKFPLYNLEITETAEVGHVTLRPLEKYRGGRGPAEDIRGRENDLAPFILTAAAMVRLGNGDEPKAPLHEGLDLLWPVHDALSFLQHRDFRLSEWSLHRTSECGDDAVRHGYHACICPVPRGEVIDVAGDWQSLVEDAASLWADGSVDERTAFRYAVVLQHTALIPNVLPLELQFMNHWTALEMLANRFCESTEVPAKASCVSIPRDKWGKVRKALKECVTGLEVLGELSSVEAQALRKHSFQQRDVRPPASEQIQAFLEHYGVAGVDRKWLERGCWLRNRIAHGHRWKEAFEKETGTQHPSQAMSWMAKQSSTLVDRYVMWLMGYEPGTWDFARAMVGRYVRRGDDSQTR